MRQLIFYVSCHHSSPLKYSGSVVAKKTVTKVKLVFQNICILFLQVVHINDIV